MNVSLVSKVVLGFSTVICLQFLVTSFGIYGQSRVQAQYATTTNTIFPMLQKSSLLTLQAQRAAQAVSMHAAQTQESALKPLRAAYEAAIERYSIEADEIRRIAKDQPEFIEAIESAIYSSNKAFKTGQQHLNGHSQYTVTTELEYRALDDFEKTWQYFTADLKDTRFVLPDGELPARWLLESLEQDANEAAGLLTRIPSLREKDKMDQAAKQLIYYWKNVKAKHTLMVERFPIMAKGLERYVALLNRHIISDDGVMKQQGIRLNIAENNALLLAQLSEELDVTIEKLNSLNTALSKLADESSNDTRSILNKTQRIMIGSLVLAIAIGIFVALMVVNGVRKPLLELVKRLERLAENDLSDISTHQANGEFDTIAKSLDALTRNLSTIIREIKNQSKDLSQLADQTFEQSAESRKEVDSQREQMSTLASAATEMEYSAKDVASDASKTYEVVGDLVLTAQNGQNIVGGNKKLINSLETELNKAAHVVDLLREESDNIGSIVSVIIGIAEQTNLLALNAAIEAARAGEQGRGFSVVADEVRALANKTQSSTSEIIGIIDSLQNKSAEANAIMEKNRSTAKACVEQSDLTSDSLSDILSGLNKINTMTSSIATASEQQSRVTSDLAETVIEISTMAEGIQRQAVKMQVSSENLQEMANHQNNLTDKFLL